MTRLFVRVEIWSLTIRLQWPNYLLWTKIYKGALVESRNKLLNSPNTFSWKSLTCIATGLGSNFKSLNDVLEIGCGNVWNLTPFHLIGQILMGNKNVELTYFIEKNY